MNIKYSIFDPSGNITALVETRVDAGKQPAAADEIMRLHPEVEQVGFVYFEPVRPVPAFLRMAGGEFCGNATMSTAALYLLRSGEETDRVRVRVTGVSRSLEVRLTRREDDENCFDAGVEMPKALEIKTENLSFNAVSENVRAVVMEGITHIVIESSSRFFFLKDDKEAAEDAIRDWCEKLGADGLGLMFLDVTKDDIILTPLVYVPGADTIFWESSCASGSSAVGMYLSKRDGQPVDVNLIQPGGVLRVAGDAAEDSTWLYGQTKLIKEIE